MACIWTTIDINWKFEPLLFNHSKTMMLKRKVDIHVFSAVEIFF